MTFLKLYHSFGEEFPPDPSLLANAISANSPGTQGNHWNRWRATRQKLDSGQVFLWSSNVAGGHRRWPRSGKYSGEKHDIASALPQGLVAGREPLNTQGNASWW